MHIPFKRILFRNSEGYIRDFELHTLTLGVNFVPLLAIRVLQQLIPRPFREENESPITKKS